MAFKENLKENKLVKWLLNTKLGKYIMESKAELKKVVWPTRKETINHTLLVIGISLGIALFMGVLDYFFSIGMEKLLEF